MQIPTLVSMRANFVLFGICVALSDAASLIATALVGKPQLVGAPVVRAATLAAAVAIAMIVKWLARRAFEAADSARHLASATRGPGLPVIAEGCSRDWLVQLHLELHATRAQRGTSQSSGARDVP